MSTIHLTPDQRARLRAASLTTGTLRDLSAQLDTSPAYLSQLLSNYRTPSADFLRRWCDAIGLSVEIEPASCRLRNSQKQNAGISAESA